MKSLKTFRQRLWRWLFNYLTKPVLLEQIITVNNVGQIKLDGRILEPNELKVLQEEVRAFQTMRLKTILFNLPKAQAESRMFADSKSWDDMLAGKLMLYNLSIQENTMLAILTAPLGNQVVVQPNPYRK